MKNWRILMAFGLRLLFPGFIVICFLMIGYALGEWLFDLKARLAPFPAYTISIFLGMLALTITISLVFFILHRVFHINFNNRTMNYFNTLTDALNRIAQGDFEVFIPVMSSDRPRGDFNELAESVNKMAKELSSMEHLRQEFISNVSHEIQSPLTSISGFAALLKNETLSLEQRRHYVDVIETESRRLSKLSDNLMKLSALESEQASLVFHYFRLDKQIESTILMLEPQWLEKNITLDLSLEKTSFKGDEELLTQVWINLFHNAVKFTPVNGRIRISLSAKENEVCCIIGDNGIGISEADQIHLFERFFKVDKSRDRSLGGNGLGLSLVKKIVLMHKGQINLKSVLGEGSEFTVTLPWIK